MLFIFERESEGEKGRERGRHGIGSRLQAPSWRHRARRGARTHEPWDRDLSQSQTLNLLSHPGAPGVLSISKETNPHVPFTCECSHQRTSGRRPGLALLWDGVFMILSDVSWGSTLVPLAFFKAVVHFKISYSTQYTCHMQWRHNPLHTPPLVENLAENGKSSNVETTKKR